MTQHEKIVKFLESGKKLTSNRAKSWGITKPTARIAELRAEGYSIYTNRTKTGTHYKLGKPSRAMVRMAYSVAGNELFGSR